MKLHTSFPFVAQLVSLPVLLSVAPAQWVGEWPMDVSSGVVAPDISGNGNDGALMNFNGSQWVPGMFGNALAFDGIDDYVSPSSQQSIYDGLGSPYSIAYWVKAPAQPNAFVYAEGTIGGSAILIFGSGQYVADADKFRVYCRNDQNDVPFTGLSNAVVYDDNWHHIVFVDVSGEITLYVDGVVDTGNIAYDPTRMPGTPGHGTFGMNTAAMGALRRGTVCCFMNGLVDDLRLYKFAMSSTDVLLAMAGVPVLPTSASIGEYGVGCGAGPFDLTGTGSAVLGGPGLQLQMEDGQPGALGFFVYGLGAIAPIDLGVVGFTGCTLYPQNFVTSFAGVLDALGTAPPTVIPIPNNPTLAFTQLNCQSVALTPTSPLVVEFSDVVVAMLGN